VKEPITLLFESGTEGVQGLPPLLLAATASRLYRYTPDGSWVLLHNIANCETGDVFGPRYIAAQLAGLFMIAHTRGGIWDLTMQSEPDGSTATYSYLVPNDSAIALGIEAANVISQSHGFFFIADVTVAGVKERSTTYWTDFESTNFILGGESQAGYFSFGSDVVVAAEPLGNSLVFYCDHSIWLANYVGGELVWSFERIYVGDDVPQYPRAVVNLGDRHVYLTDTQVRVLVRGERTPRLVEWMDDAAGCIFLGMRQELTEGMPEPLLVPLRGATGSCIVPCGFWDATERLLYFSWRDAQPEADPDADIKGLPNWTLAISLANETACLLDYGITAGVLSRQPAHGVSETWRTMLWRTMGCPANPDLNENDPFPPNTPAGVPMEVFYNAGEDPLWTLDEMKGTYSYLGPPSPDSWCTQMIESGEGCITVCSDCTGLARLVIASAEDFALKEFSWRFDRRERISAEVPGGPWHNTPASKGSYMAVGPNPVSIATYVLDSYPTLFQTDAVVGKTNRWRFQSMDIAMAKLDADPTDATADMPWPVNGQGASAESARCPSWNYVSADAFNCKPPSVATKSYLAGEENPTVHLEVEGRYLAYRFWCGGDDNIGPVAFTGVTYWGGSASCK